MNQEALCIFFNFFVPNHLSQERKELKILRRYWETSRSIIFSRNGLIFMFRYFDGNFTILRHEKYTTLWHFGLRKPIRSRFFFQTFTSGLEKSILIMKMLFPSSNCRIFLKNGPPLRTLEKKDHLETIKIYVFLTFFIKIKTTVGYFILLSTNTNSPKIQNLKRNGLQ